MQLSAGSIPSGAFRQPGARLSNTSIAAVAKALRLLLRASATSWHAETSAVATAEFATSSALAVAADWSPMNVASASV